MKAVKIVAFVLGGLVVLLGAVAAFIVATFDANKWKGEISQLVQEKKSRSLKIEGDLSLSLFPSVGVQLGKATLSEHKSEQVFASVDSARVSVRLMPLLSKQVVVDTVELGGMKARLVRFKDGRMNIDDLLSKDEKEPPARFDIAGVKFANGELAWRDEKAGQEVTLSGLDLTTGRLANAASDKFELSAKLAGNKPRLAAQLAAKGEYRYDLDKKSYGGAKLDLRLNGDVADLKALELALNAAALQLAGANEVAVDQLLLTAKGKEGGDAFELRLEAPKLALAADKASGAAVNAALKLTGAQRAIDAKIALSGVEGKSQSLQAGKLTLELDARQGETTVKGNLASALAANLEKQTVELPAFSGELNVANPQMPMKSVKLPLTGGLRADIDGQTAAVHANTQFDESKIAAKVNVSRFSPLALGFDLDIDRLNVDKYLPPKPAAAGGKEADKPAAEKPFDFSALKGLNASGTVKIGQLQVSNVKASNVRLEVKAAGGKLDVAPMTANLYDGSLAGALSVNANNNHVAVKQNLANVNINPLMKDALDKDVLEGRGNVALDVATAGTTVTAMKKGLNGAASLNLKDGAIKGINLAKTFRETKAVFTTRKDAMQQAKQTEKTDFSELSATFRIANGVARNDDLSMKSPFIRLGGAGDINIGEDRMDYLAKASVVATAGGQGGKELEHLKGLTVPVRVSGPFDKLAYNIEFGGLVAEAAKAKAEEKVKEKVQEKAGGVLKGLFKK
ncbi:MAG: cell envelope biogenesis protein AsmA [Rhodocyclaceae bacterium]|uniref:AsmA family protein n=1 Tax=Candidatus Desulfobacillus denitrificans TaxID=2608985 RepID=A0A809R3L4_9PROT|nr:AsmA family protein [Candidatus Desulfobacillus denitrificans]GJQ54620.1 MAG: cell envelope biogenesis protein AsmA [Rhodocyclaceae bacterium]